MGYAIEYRAVGTKIKPGYTAQEYFGRPAETIHAAHVALEDTRDFNGPWSTVKIQRREVTRSQWRET